MALKNFSGTVAVITGGASGIGLATARALHAEGAHVVLADINISGLEQAEQSIRQSNPSSTGEVSTVHTNVTNEVQVQALMHRAFEKHGRIDLVVTSAGIGQGGPVDLFSGDEMQNLMNINFMGTYHCVRAALPTMRQQESGHFVFLSSVAGKLCAPLLTGYCASKWAVRGFSSALRAELYGTNIGVTTVYPAWVDTPMIHQEAAGIQFLNIEALLTPEQVAREIMQAVLNNRTDLTLAPNQDIASLLQLMQNDQDQAEQIAGAAFRQRLEEFTAQQAQ